ncbi:MAG: Nif3-like dinuclear metal center hexameric protein [Bacteroidota bacterium]
MRLITVHEVVSFLNEVAPFSLQESYDNSGLLAGDPGDQVNGILVSLDMTEAVVDEAIKKGCNVVVSHHPILFRPLKSLTGKNHVERTVMCALR